MKRSASVTIGACCVAASDCIVYALIDPAGTPFYVGIGRSARPDDHFREADTAKSSHKVNKIRQLRRRGVADAETLWVLADGLSAADAMAMEVRLIALWGRRSTGDGPLTNLTPGGDRSPMQDPVTRAKCAEALRAVKATPEYKAKHAAATRAAMARPEVKAKCAEAARAAHARPEVKAKHSSANRARWADPEARARQSEALRATSSARSADPAYRAKLSEAMFAVWARRRAAKSSPRLPAPPR